MVGVAGRSKGCNTCRKRKIACGLERPQCVQCTKSDRVCTGYQRQHVFIVNHALPRRSGKGNPAPVANGTGSSDSLLEGLPAQAMGLSKVKQRRPPKKPSLQSSVSPAHAYRQMLFDCFMRSWLPLDELGGSEESFIHGLAQLPNQTPALTTAILSISLSRIGRVNCDENLGKESLKHYTVGLSELQKALYDPAEMHSDETLAACLLLGLYELFECPGSTKTAYAIHNNGCARLIQSRGPKAHMKGLAHSLFLAIRPQCIYQALERHEPTFLTNPEWMEIPWNTRPKSPMDRLTDYIAQAPGIFGTTDGFDRMEPVQILITALSIIDKCWQMDAELADFYLHLDNSVPGPMYWPELSTMANEADEMDADKGKVFPVAFYFFNLRMASTLMLYWANLCMMYHGMTLLYYHVMAVVPVDRKQLYAHSDIPAALKDGIPPCPQDCACKSSASVNGYTPCLARFDMTKLRPLGHRHDFLAPGRNVLQSVEYCLQKKMKDMGPGSCATPLAIVLETVKPYPHAQREVQWGRNVMLGLEESLPYLKCVRN